METVAALVDRIPLPGSVLDCEMLALSSLLQYEVNTFSLFLLFKNEEIEKLWTERFPILASFKSKTSSNFPEIRSAVSTFINAYKNQVEDTRKLEELAVKKRALKRPPSSTDSDSSDIKRKA